MKKIISVFLAMMMVLGLSTTAFAEGEPAENTTIKIEAPASGTGTTTARTYKAYRLLNLETSHKEEGHDYECPYDENDPDSTHVDECYNYAYTLNADYADILKAEVYDHATEAFWTEIQEVKPAEANDITEEQVLKYLSKHTNDGGTVFGTLRAVADRLYRDILAVPELANDPDGTLATGTNTGFAQGYWLIADTTDLDEKVDDSNSVALLDTKTEAEIVLKPKTALPLVEKKVKDINSSEQVNSLDLAWVDSADRNMGDEVPFKLTATLPANLEAYDTYTMTFHDTLSAGLTLIPGTIEIHMYDTKNLADVDNNMDGGTKLYQYNPEVAAHANYIVDTDPDDNHSLDLTITNVKEIATAAAGKVIVVVYKAKLNEGAALGTTGNPNEVYLEFSNDPYSDDTGVTPEDEVVVYTYGLKIYKVDSLNHPLKGAGFILYKKMPDGTYAPVIRNNTDAQTGELKGENMTEFVWAGLDDGHYKLVEKTVPDGYNKMEEKHFSITAKHDNGLTEINGGVMGSGDLGTGLVSSNIINNTGTVLPSTGAQGTMMLIGGGSMFVIVAAVFMVTRKKMSVYAD